MAREWILQTARLVATTRLPGDADDLFAMHSDAESMRFVRHGRPETRAETADLIDQYMAEQAAGGFTKWRLVGLDGLDGRLVARAGFGLHRDGREMGYTIRRDLWGQGLATEIAAALVEWHREHAPDCALYAYVAVGNPASRRVLQKVGFDYIGPEDHSGTPCELFHMRTQNATSPRRFRR